MPSAEQLLAGSPRELLLRFINELYSIFVVKPAMARLPKAAAWLQRGCDVGDEDGLGVRRGG